MNKLAGMDTVGINGLRLFGRLGTKKWEGMTKQEIIVDVQLGLSGRQAQTTDDLSDTVNLVEVKRKLAAYIEAATHNLCESLAHELARIVLTEFKVEATRVLVKKPGQFRNADSEFALVERNLKDFA